MKAIQSLSRRSARHYMAVARLATSQSYFKTPAGHGLQLAIPAMSSRSTAAVQQHVGSQPFQLTSHGGTQAGYGEQRTPAQTLAEHRAALSELRQDLRTRTSMHMPNTQPRKTSFGAGCPYEQCSSILVRELEVGATHRRRVLQGRLVTQAIKMQSVQTVLEDEAGGLVPVHIYNVPGLPPHITTEALLAQAQALFDEGDRLAVIEPFYKVMLDGTRGVRVDNPNEVLFLSEGGEVGPSAADLGAAAERFSDHVLGELGALLRLRLSAALQALPASEPRRPNTVHALPGPEGPPPSKPRRPNRSKKGKKKGGGSRKPSDRG